MAIVKEMITSNGVHVYIHDDLYAGVSEEEIARRRAHFKAVAAQIMRNAALRKIAEQQTEDNG